MLRETKSRVRTGEEIGESFWMGRGLRQVPFKSTTIQYINGRYKGRIRED